jgi:hypothetical protein
MQATRKAIAGIDFHFGMGTRGIVDGLVAKLPETEREILMRIVRVISFPTRAWLPLVYFVLFRIGVLRWLFSFRWSLQRFMSTRRVRIESSKELQDLCDSLAGGDVLTESVSLRSSTSLGVAGSKALRKGALLLKPSVLALVDSGKDDLSGNVGEDAQSHSKLKLPIWVHVLPKEAREQISYEQSYEQAAEYPLTV